MMSFTEFFVAIHGYEPFPWQSALAQRVVETGDWPRTMGLPTGSGKTACIDIALYHLVVASANPAAARAARRIVFVVDRRIIVDEATNRAQRIRKRLVDGVERVLIESRKSLERLTPVPSSPLFDVVTLRGGVPRESGALRDPALPTVVLATVDQIGSRLLFRGYGVSERMSPIHAGLFGIDTVLFLDEAHIARAFEKTVRGIVREQARAEQTIGPRALQLVNLSATLGTNAEFELSVDDREHPVLKRRLMARKPLKVLDVAKREELPKKFAELVEDDLATADVDPNEARQIGVVVNRVATARATFEILRKRLEGRADVALLVGQIRPLDRDALLGTTEVPGLSARLASSERPRGGDLPIVVVATQTIEVGADYDFHALYTEGAPYASLRQRVGRLNRLGVRQSARGAIIWCEAELKNPDPIYGDLVQRTRASLAPHVLDGVLELGIDGAPSIDETPSPVEVPVLSPSILGLYTQTHPRPASEPEVSQYLHGFVANAPEIGVIWREGLPEEAADAIAVLEAMPPLSLEAMRMRLSDFRRWMGGARKDVGEGDMELDSGDDDAEVQGSVLVSYEGQLRLVAIMNVRPGSLVILRSERGGSDGYGFDASSLVSVDDHHSQAREKLGKSPVAIFSASMIATKTERDAMLVASAAALLADIDDEADGLVDVRARVLTWLIENTNAHPRLAAMRDLMDRLEVIELLRRRADGLLFAVVFREKVAKIEDLWESDESLQRPGQPVLLESHCFGVGERAARLAAAASVAPPVANDVALAGKLHDLGKADPRFQALLGADEEGNLLAKGRRRSGRSDPFVERGERHEAYSVAVALSHTELLATAQDRDLVLHLIGSHHGYGRALQPSIPDKGVRFSLQFDGRVIVHDGGAPRLGAVDSEWPERFRCLERRYGAWGLAYLEALLRLADHQRSAEEAQG